MNAPFSSFSISRSVFPTNLRRASTCRYCLYGLAPNFCTCSVNSLTTCANRAPSAAETHSRRKRSSSIPKSGSINLNGLCTFLRLQVALLVVAVSGMTAAHEDAIGALGERLDYEIGMYHARAHDADDTNARWVLAAGHARQIRACIGAPVATQGDNQRFKGVCHYATPNAAWICASI